MRFAWPVTILALMIGAAWSAYLFVPFEDKTLRIVTAVAAWIATGAVIIEAEHWWLGRRARK